jgi:hypothetical protein
MPALPNVRQELFCQNIVKGMSALKAYEAAGYKKHWDNPYKLKGRKRVSERILELLKTTETDLKVTVESMTNVYADILLSAKKVGNFNAAKGAADSLAKMHGLMIDRKETGAPGDFSRMDDDQIREFISATASEIGAHSRGSEGAGEAGEEEEG